MPDRKDQIGYGKPPKHSHWKKGQSGNPRGRPKGARGLKNDLDRVLRKVLTIEGRGTTLKGTTQLLALEMLARRAATGDVRSIKALVDLVLTVFGPGDRGGETEQLSENDRKLLDTFLSDLADGSGSEVLLQPGGSDPAKLEQPEDRSNGPGAGDD